MIKVIPQIFIVKGKNYGKKTTITGDTLREVGVSGKIRNDAERLVELSYENNCDTLRNVKNNGNIQFPVIRKINQKVVCENDLIRVVKSDEQADAFSFYIQADNKKIPVECTIFKYTNLFPFPNKYVKVQIDNDGNFGYLPLVPVGSDYDSSLRYTDNDGKIWQIASSIEYNILDNVFLTDNYFINLLDKERLFYSLKNIFDSRVERENDTIYLNAPPTISGLIKMFVIGLDIRISWINDGSNDWNNAITLSTHENGLCDTSFGGDNKYKANAMLVKLQAGTRYKIDFNNTYGKISYADEDKVKGCLIFGRTVEQLKEKSSTYQSLIDTVEYCTTDKNYNMVLANKKEYVEFKTMNLMKQSWLNYTNSKRVYDYYDLVDIKYQR